MADKVAYLKMVNANGDFADFNQQTVEQCMFFILMFHVSDILHVTLLCYVHYCLSRSCEGILHLYFVRMTRHFETVGFFLFLLGSHCHNCQKVESIFALDVMLFGVSVAVGELSDFTEFQSSADVAHTTSVYVIYRTSCVTNGVRQ